MRRPLAILALALVGLFSAAGMGFAAYLVSRDSVAVPVTRLQPKPRELAPAGSQGRRKTPPPRTIPAPPPPPGPEPGDDHGGRGRGGGGGGGSGHGGGGDD